MPSIQPVIHGALVGTVLIAMPLLAQSRPTGRIVGVFNDATGAPVVGAEVVDLSSGTKTLTSETGTATLAFLDQGTTIVQIRKLGFVSKLQTVTVSPSDTTDLTVVLSPVNTLPTVVTTARASADTVRALAINGFYDRKHGSGAPQSAFITSADLDRWKIAYLDDLRSYNGRGICGAVYVDDMPIEGGVWLGPGDSSGRMILDPTTILAIENYTTATVPAKYRMTRVGTPILLKKPIPERCAVTLIWLK